MTNVDFGKCPILYFRPLKSYPDVRKVTSPTYQTHQHMDREMWLYFLSTEDVIRVFSPQKILTASAGVEFVTACCTNYGKIPSYFHATIWLVGITEVMWHLICLSLTEAH